MPTLLKSCKDVFGAKDLYQVLGLKTTASAREVKRAYHKASLVVHPDRVQQSEKTEATRKFQILGQVYSVLSNKEKRKVYDQTGDVDDDVIVNEDRDWRDYWRCLFKEITPEDIQQFEDTYRESAEELNDLKEVYNDCEGDLIQIADKMLCATDADIPRFRSAIADLIVSGELREFPAFKKLDAKKLASRKRKAEKEATEAEELQSMLGQGSLKDQIMKRQETRALEADSFFAHLEKKYATKPRTKKK